MAGPRSGALILGSTSLLVSATWTERLVLAAGGMALAFALSATVRAVSFLLLALILGAGLVLALVRLALWGWAFVL
jgi:hypothetical protein